MNKFYKFIDSTRTNQKPTTVFVSQENRFSTALNDAATANHIPIVDTTQLQSAFLQTKTCISTKSCFGDESLIHIGAIGYGHLNGSTLALASLCMQALLAVICK